MRPSETFPDGTTHTVVTIGDSNGESECGWVAQLQRIRPQDRILNHSISGNTIGFDNNGQQSKNTLRNIDFYLSKSEASCNGGRISHVIVCLGTNDCKADFDDMLPDVPKHLDALVVRIRGFHYIKKPAPEIIVVSPPPYGPDSILKEKYHGGASRIARLVPELEAVAKKHKIPFIDMYSVLKADYESLAPDGVHMQARGQAIIARAISRELDR